VEPESLLLCWQDPANGRYTKPDKFSAFHRNNFYIYFNIIFPSTSMYFNLFLSFWLSHRNPTHSSSLYACYMSLPSNTFWHDSPSFVWHVEVFKQRKFLFLWKCEHGVNFRILLHRSGYVPKFAQSTKIKLIFQLVIAGIKQCEI
jgi:hypothetical protein